jgi:formylglycine-generating enzyme required for sulfatase activity
VPDYDDRTPATAPAGSFLPNPAGFFNLGGNVAEWVHDVYAVRPPEPGQVERDPTGPEEGEYHVVRGASWMTDRVTELRLSVRESEASRRPDLGFRIARFADHPG